MSQVGQKNFRPLHSSAQLLRGSMVYLDAEPTSDLRGQVVDFWQISPRNIADVVPSQLYPTQLLRLRFMLYPSRVVAVLYGPSSSAHRKGLYLGDQVSFGVSISAQAGRQLLGCDVGQFRDTRIALELIWPNEISQLSEQLHRANFSERVKILSRFLRAKFNASRQAKLSFLSAYWNLENAAGGGNIGNICRDSGLSHRTLDRLFKENVGLTPKETERILRFQRGIKAMFTGNAKSDLLGYSDQSHWIREFKSMVGMPPGQYKSCVTNIHTVDHAYWKGTSAQHYEGVAPSIVAFPDRQGPNPLL